MKRKVQQEVAAKFEPAFGNALDLPDVKHNKLKNQGAKKNERSIPKIKFP